jgi:hypothetical protein
MCCLRQHLQILWNLDCLSPSKISTFLNLLFTNALALKALFVWSGAFGKVGWWNFDISFCNIYNIYRRYSSPRVMITHLEMADQNVNHLRFWSAISDQNM